MSRTPYGGAYPAVAMKRQEYEIEQARQMALKGAEVQPDKAADFLHPEA